MKLLDLQDKCWICLSVNGFTDEAVIRKLYEEVKPDLSQKELEFYGKKIKMPRLTAWYGDEEYNYSGTINEAKPMPPSVVAIRDSLEQQFKHLPGFNPKKTILNSVLLNLYRDGNDSVDWHSDNESGLGPTNDNIIIASITFGNPRNFVLRNKKTKQKISVELGNGDVIIMGGQTQKFWVHKVPKTSKEVGKRLNLTFRSIR